MKITQDAPIFEKAHAALVKEHGIHMNPDALQTVLETVLDGRVTNAHAERRFRQGIEANTDLHERLVKARYVLRETVSLLDDVLAWTGGPGREKHVREQLGALLDDLNTHLTP